MKTPLTTAQRSKRMRERRKAAGKRYLRRWVDPEDYAWILEQIEERERCRIK